jgi:hypothetical protein
MSKPAIQSQDLNADQQSCAAWIARFLKARGIDRVFGLQGGHIQPIWDHVARQGIRIIDVRDEGAAVHMAHAHAELTGQFGVAMVTAGPGVTNTVTAIANASLARIPVLLIGGCTSRPQANMGPLQDAPLAQRGFRNRSCVSSTRLWRARWAIMASPDPSTSRCQPMCCARMCRRNSFLMNGSTRSRRAQSLLIPLR